MGPAPKSRGYHQTRKEDFTEYRRHESRRSRTSRLLASLAACSKSSCKICMVFMYDAITCYPTYTCLHVLLFGTSNIEVEI
ncbi:hypothetical protein J1N35_021849 [Gossypium stocksii]|uniref:Uncharacterized protein n=1 Tax=Gossypium stocksii TaxID=47602 RepID=A0A9D4A1P9_9ROSI|nr:hypothetical protein J1N35_021849 [Gossypium stocksii]